MNLFKKLQNEVGEWSRENFGEQPDVNPFMGVAEEFGELVESVDLNSEPIDEEIDSMGDILVYLADFCSIRGIDYQKAYDRSKEYNSIKEDHFEQFIIHYGKLTRSVLKQRQGIRLDEDRVGEEAELEALSNIILVLDSFAEKRGYTIEMCINRAWDNEVSDREWDADKY